MKRINLLLLGILFFSFGYSQSEYVDAIKIKDLKHTFTNNVISFQIDSAKDIQLLASILVNYIDRENIKKIKTDKILLQEISKAFNENPFINISGKNEDDPFVKELDKKSTSFKLSNLSSVGNLNVTSIADGLAQFLIKRGREELNIAFFQRMKEFLEENVEAKTLFPSTVQFLGKIASYRYSEFLPTLREAFYKDINNLIVNLNLLIDLPKYQDLLKALPEIRIAIRSAKIISELSQPDSSMHPANLIDHLAGLQEWGEMNINLQSSWQVLNVISQSVRRIDTIEIIKSDTTIAPGVTVINVSKKLSDEITITEPVKVDSGQSIIKLSKSVKTKISDSVAWIKFSDFNKNILSDSIALKIYLGLLYQKMDSIAFRDTEGNLIKVQDYMRDNADNIFRIADLIENFLVLANDVEQSIKTLKDKKGNLTNDDYYTYIQKAIDVIDYGFKVANTIKDGIADDRYIKMACNANDLYKNIYTKNYNAAVMNGYSILEEVLIQSSNAIEEKEGYLSSVNTETLTPEKLAAFKNDTAVLAKSIKNMKDSAFLKNCSIDKRYEVVENILKYGNLMASIVKAESSQEAEAAIEAAVLPAGSSSVKKNTAWNFSLNAYIGGYFGRSMNSTNEINGNNAKAGVTAPVGFAVSKGLWYYRNGNPIGSISLYGTLIDVGAIAGYRLNDDSTALDSKITLNDIFAPGGYVVYGLGLPFKWASYVPLSVGYGWQYSSKLYQRKDDGKLAISDKSRWRSNWFVAIDIPLVNFYSRNYKNKK